MMHYNEFISKEERKKLFDEVWKEPVIKVAKEYGLSDNGLRKRCNKLKIPLPPMGYWAKLQAGKKVANKPELPYLDIFDDAEDFQSEFKDLEDEETQNINDGLKALTKETKEAFLSKCSKIKVPSKIDSYCSKIIEHKNEIEYRKIRDKEYYYDSRYIHLPIKNTVSYRDNKAVIPISVSDNMTNRAYRIVDTFFSAAHEFKGKIQMDYGTEDNLSIHIFDYCFSFIMKEYMTKRRDIDLDIQKNNSIKNFRPAYEKVYNGELEIKLIEKINDNQKDYTPKMIFISDKENSRIEDQLGDMFIEMYKLANEAMVARQLVENEYKRKQNEKNQQLKLEAENRRHIEEEALRHQEKQDLINNIEKQMYDWNTTMSLTKYADELDCYIENIGGNEEKEIIKHYITLVREKALKQNPVKRIINIMKELGEFDSNEI